MPEPSLDAEAARELIESGRPPAALVPQRLSVGTSAVPSSMANGACDLIVRQACDWQTIGGSANELEAATWTHGLEKDRAAALVCWMASTGEKLALAYAAALEVGSWREFREGVDFAVEHEMCMRGMAEAQSHFVIGAGHGLANVAVRALALDPTLRVGLVERLSHKEVVPSFAPFSKKPCDMLSLNSETCKKLLKVVRSTEQQEVIALIEPVAEYARGQKWRELLERRNEDFHRLRPRTHGTEGVAQQSPWRQESGTYRISLIPEPYAEAEGLAEETAQMATEAMCDLASAMEAFMDRWPAAIYHLAGLRIRRT